MNNYILKKYLNNISKKDIYNLAQKYQIILNSNELENIYQYIQDNKQDYFNNNLSQEKIIQDAKKILTDNNYKTLYYIYSIYKDKI